MPIEEIVVTPAAEADLDDIWFSIAMDTVAAADRFLDLIEDRVRQLAQFPESGRARPDIAHGVRSLTVGSYLVLYKAEPNIVTVVRVVHGARDVTALL